QRALGQAYVSVVIKGPEHPELMNKLAIRSFPTTLLATSDGQIVDQLKGYTDAAKLYEHMRATWQQQQTRVARR
ncbi:MAG: hypothetical protein KDB23_21815, partial [Planctomycetales bacterium]|nr:hypothetical protein [Planctomycetales bacterium]